MKLQNFCMAKDTIIWRRQPPELEKVFICYTSDRGFVSKTYKEVKNLDTEKTNNSIKKTWYGLKPNSPKRKTKLLRNT